MQPTAKTTLPLKATDRILYLDILRGLAILFIFLANITYLSGTTFYSDELAASFATAHFDHALEVFFFTLIDGKFYSIFSILFGIGFVVQYNNVMKGKRSFVPFFTRRMLGLLLIGGCHLVFVWPRDILTLYALLGLVLILFRNFNDKRLLRWAAVLLVLPVLHWSAMYLSENFYPYPLFRLVSERAATLGLVTPETMGTDSPRFSPAAQIAGTDFSTWFEMQVKLPFLRLGGILMEGRIFKVLALFLIGIWAGRQILDKNILENSDFLKKIAIWGIAIGLPINVLRAVVKFGEHEGGAVWNFLYHLFYALSVVPMACGYAAGIALLVLAKPQLLSWLAPVGRTALSNYLFQSFIAIGIFYGIGLGLTGHFGFSIVAGIALLIFAWQVLFSTVWLRYFRFGPMEWIWRQMTYGRLIDIRHRQVKAPVAVELKAVKP
jgi:uncharacterized protein